MATGDDADMRAKLKSLGEVAAVNAASPAVLTALAALHDHGYPKPLREKLDAATRTAESSAGGIAALAACETAMNQSWLDAIIATLDARYALKNHTHA